MEYCGDSYQLKGVEEEDCGIICHYKNLKTHQFEESEEDNITAIGVKRDLLRLKVIFENSLEKFFIRKREVCLLGFRKKRVLK